MGANTLNKINEEKENIMISKQSFKFIDKKKRNIRGSMIDFVLNSINKVSTKVTIVNYLLINYFSVTLLVTVIANILLISAENQVSIYDRTLNLVLYKAWFKKLKII